MSTINEPTCHTPLKPDSCRLCKVYARASKKISIIPRLKVWNKQPDPPPAPEVDPNRFDWSKFAIESKRRGPTQTRQRRPPSNRSTITLTTPQPPKKPLGTKK